MKSLLCLLAVPLALAFTAAAPPKSAAGPVVTLADFAARHKLSGPRQSGNTLLFTNAAGPVKFEINSRKVVVRNVLVWMNEGLTLQDDQGVLNRDDAQSTLAPLLQPGTSAPPARPVVFLDPGHGGEDTGALGPRGLAENKLTLDIAKRVRSRLAKSKISVKFSRRWNSTLSRADRLESARKAGASVFVSLHLNHSANPDASGLETYVATLPGFASTAGNGSSTNAAPGNRFDPANIRLAYQVQKEVLASAKPADRGIKHARFDVLQGAPCPAVLVECGFLSNRAEATRLEDPAFRESLAAGIANGIKAYLAGAPSETPVSP